MVIFVILQFVFIHKITKDYNMRTQLTEKDIKELKCQCRMGYVLPAMVFILGTLIVVAIYELNFNKHTKGLNLELDLFITLGFLIVSFIISYLMNRKYYADIRKDEKVAKTKTVQEKTGKKDFEAGSGNVTTLPHNRPMNEFARYDLVVENVKYRVDKELYDKCSAGDEVLFFYAPKSNYLLSIEKK